MSNKKWPDWWPKEHRKRFKYIAPHHLYPVIQPIGLPPSRVSRNRKELFDFDLETVCLDDILEKTKNINPKNVFVCLYYNESVTISIKVSENISEEKYNLLMEKYNKNLKIHERETKIFQEITKCLHASKANKEKEKLLKVYEETKKLLLEKGYEL